MTAANTLNYLERIREYYQALGYGSPYVWARFDDVPFSPLSKPLSSTKVAIITTAALFQPNKGEQGPGAPYNGAAKFFQVYAQDSSKEPVLGISHIAYDRVHTKAQDQGTYFPLQALNRLMREGLFASISPRFYGLPTNRSQRRSMNVDCAELVRLCKEDDVDAAVLVPNCPVCHQSVSLAARALEAAGISTVVMGCVKDIVEHVGVPRFLFNNFPLGNSAGLPDDPISQTEIARQALGLLETATKPRTTKRSEYEWNGDPKWQQHYCNAAMLSKQEIQDRKAEFDKGKEEAAKIKRVIESRDGFE